MVEHSLKILASEEKATTTTPTTTTTLLKKAEVLAHIANIRCVNDAVLDSYLVGALSPDNHKGLHQG